MGEVDYARVFCLDGSMSCKTEKYSCCSECPGQQYCSPRSGKCYDKKRSKYYQTCDAISPPEPEPVDPSEPETPSCCAACNGKGYCSPGSGSCYDWKKKGYYEKCFTGPAAYCSDCGGEGFCS